MCDCYQTRCVGWSQTMRQANELPSLWFTMLTACVTLGVAWGFWPCEEPQPSAWWPLLLSLWTLNAVLLHVLALVGRKGRRC